MLGSHITKLIEDPFNFEPPTPENQQHIFEGKMWYVKNLIELAETLPSFNKPLKEMRAVLFNSKFPGSESWSHAELAYHYNVALRANLDCPIILGADGRIMDGHHRLLRALIEKNDHIKVVQFVVDPDPDKYL